MFKKLKAWLDNLHTFLYMLYHPWDVADVVREIQRGNKPRIRVGIDKYTPSRIIKPLGGKRYIFDAAILYCWLEFLDENKAP